VTRFVDVHVHPPLEEFYKGAFAPFCSGISDYLGREMPTLTVDEFADEYRSRNGIAVLWGWDAESATGQSAFGNDRIAGIVAAHPDVFVGLGSVDPHKGAAAVAGVHDARRLGLKGIAFHPPAQRFSPADREAYPIWEVAEEEELLVFFHTGFTVLGAGTPGGSGIRLAGANPMAVDQVAADFPGLNIVLAHPGLPWLDEAVALVRHKSNVHLELSGWLPERLPSVLAEALAGPIIERVLLGTDFPIRPLDGVVEAWEKSKLPKKARSRILVDNAAGLLGLEV
jgi:predicted TIM-barrel fold metal-dependent hydrolase